MWLAIYLICITSSHSIVVSFNILFWLWMLAQMPQYIYSVRFNVYIVKK